jgi:hypothetical protein
MLAREVAMPSQPTAGDPPAAGRPAGRLAAPSYSAAEWRSLTRLPGRVVVAAITTEADSPRRPVAAGLAGLEGIAAGRAFDSDLVRAVATAVYAESDEEPPAAQSLADSQAGPAEVLASCRAVVRLLAGRADPADSAAYRQWVQSIAARVCRASRPGGLLGFAGEQVSAADRRFLDDLGRALGLR